MSRNHLYFDRKGQPISMEDCSKLMGDISYSRVAETTGLGCWVSTVWLGINHRHGDGPPLIFETMVFRIGTDGKVNFSEEVAMDRYSTEEEALAGHERMCSLHAYVLDLMMRHVDGKVGNESD